MYSGSKQDAADGAWVPVAPAPGALTINTGDMLQVWSNGAYKAPEHRVRASTTRERFSAPYFFNPSYATRVAPVVGGAAAGARARRYAPIEWGYFRGQRFAGDFADEGREIQIEDYEIPADP